MKNKSILFLLLLVLACGNSCGGSQNGVTSSPDTQPDSVTVLAREYVTNTVRVPGGNYSSPFIASTSNTEYILDGDITADGTAIAVRASKVVINLNGKTITYNQTVPGEGVTIDAYNLTDIAIANGSIIQGAAKSEGDVYGRGNNPIKSLGVSRLQVANINARYGGRDVVGIYAASADHSIFENNTLEDTFTVGTFKDRHQGIDAIQATSGYNIFRNNTILNCRQRGLQVGSYDEVYGNIINVNSLATNSYGILVWKKQHVKVHDNIITGIGEHPIGIGAAGLGTDDIEIYNNTIETQTTRIGEEYGGSVACFDSATPCGNYAVGFRTTWGGNNISFHDNTITVHADSRYQGTYSPTGQPVVVNGKGRGLMVAINAGESSKFYNNTITSLDKDGSGKVFGIACTGNNAGEMIFEGNTVTSNILNVALSDEYGYCAGHPLFVKNIFVKSGEFPAYRTVAVELDGYFEGTGRFVSNSYQGGASQESTEINAAGKGSKSVYFGRELTAKLEILPATLVIDASLALLNGGVPFDSTALTGTDGTAKLIVYDYEIYSNSGSALTRYLAPHTIQAVIGTDTYSTQADTSLTSWDALTSSGTFTPKLYLNSVHDAGKKLTISY